MMLFNFLAEAVTKETKKWVYILLAILLLIIVLLGLIVTQIKKRASQQAKEIDLYVSDYCKEELLKTPKDVVKYVRKREFRNFYLKSRIMLRIFLIAVIVYVLLMKFVFANNYAESKLIISDMFFKFEWTMTRFYKFINLPTDVNLLSKPIPHLTFQGYSTYILFFITIFTIVVLLINGFNLTAKLDRSKKISIDVFGKTIDTSKEVAK